MFTKTMRLTGIVAMVALVLSALPSTSEARMLEEPDPEYARTEATPIGIIGDLLIARPAGIAMTFVGAGFFTISLPFTAWGGNMEIAAEEFVRRPARYTFKYPLGTWF